MTEDEETWWERAARAFGDALASFYQKDWMEGANCQADTQEDTSFIRKPDEVTAKRWARTCSRCDVIGQCYRWANSNEVTGVFVAGEWRE